MAIGIAIMFNIKYLTIQCTLFILINSDFWRKWHITKFLIRDYIYIPMGGLGEHFYSCYLYYCSDDNFRFVAWRKLYFYLGFL